MFFDNPNLRWGNPSYLLEPGDPGYVAPLPPNPETPTKRKKVKRNSYYPIRQADQIIWLVNFMNKLSGKATALGLTTGQVAAAVADCGWLVYVLQTWLSGVRTWALACTNASVEAQTGAGSSAQVLPAFTAPALPTGVAAVNPGALNRIFALVQTIKEGGKGTGLGLATVFGIVQQHQGWINVYSEVGHGTTFRIYLPRLARMSAQKPDHPPLTTMRGGHETILLVEDEQSLRVLMRISLTRLGYSVLEAPTGVKAMDVWNEHRKEISLLLTELLMPDGMTGKELARRLLQENPELKVVYMSGYSADVVGKDFPLEAGVNFLAKPFEAHKLAQTIRDSLDKPVMAAKAN